MKDFIEFMAYMVGALWAIILIVCLVSLPIAYLDGSAKSDYLAQQKDIYIPWYRATFLPDTIFIDASIKMEDRNEHP